MTDYIYKLKTDNLDEEKIQKLNNLCYNNPGYKILVNIDNTRGLSSQMLMMLNSNVDIRVAGGYTEEKMQVPRYQEFETKVIYTRNELVKIVGELEKIESGIKDSWSDYQKLIYVYTVLKRNIKYDPKYESKDSYDIRTLRGLVTKQTVCAGYAIILKEILDRQGIKAEYVGGNVPSGSGHAWNIVQIGDKKYPIDLTWDASLFRSGKFDARKYLGQNTPSFRKAHIPGSWEPIQDYEKELSSLPEELVTTITAQINREQDYMSTTYYGKRDDGSRFLVAQIANSKKLINGKECYRYVYTEVDQYGTPSEPLVLYSATNVQYLMHCKEFKKPIPFGYEWAVDNYLFSKQNIRDSLKKGTYYIGSVRKTSQDKKVHIVNSVREIEKPKEICDLLAYPTRQFTRSNGSCFTVQKMSSKPIQINDVKLNKYDVFEIIQENGKNVVKRNSVFSEMDLLADDRQEFADDFMSRHRLDRKMKEAGGYIGYFGEHGLSAYDSRLVAFFDTTKKIDDSILTKRPRKFLPSFDELRDLALNYEVSYVQDTQYPNRSKLMIKDLKTGEIVTDKALKEKIVFADIWLKSAGIKWYSGEQKPGAIYAFNDPARELYNYICKVMCDDVDKMGVIDTVKLYKNVDFLCYKYSSEIVTNLFRDEGYTEFINEYVNSLVLSDKVPTIDLQPLYNIGFAEKLSNTQHTA